jgi:hypothetical protein
MSGFDTHWVGLRQRSRPMDGVRFPALHPTSEAFRYRPTPAVAVLQRLEFDRFSSN